MTTSLLKCLLLIKITLHCELRFYLKDVMINLINGKLINFDIIQTFNLFLSTFNFQRKIRHDHLNSCNIMNKLQTLSVG